MGINFPRKFFHLFFSLFLYFLFLKLDKKNFQIILVIFLFSLLIWEFLRLKKPSLLPLKNLWIKLLKEKEKDKPTDALFYLSGILISTFISPYQYVGALILILGISDPLAEIFGKLYKGKNLCNEKTVGGSLTFFFSTLVIVSLEFKEFSFILILFSVILTLTELFTERDNLWIPLVGSLFARFFLTS